MRIVGLLCAAAAAIGTAQAETVAFDAAPINPTPLMRRMAETSGTVATPSPGDHIGGELYRPAGAVVSPALVMLHGCAGRPPAAFERARAERFVHLGYAVLAVDSLGPRGVREDCNMAPVVIDRVGDAFGALAWLSAQPSIDAARIGVIGYSQGGSVALYAVSRTGAAEGYAKGFAFAIAYYPSCAPILAETIAPALILVGDRDDWASVVDCRTMLAAHDPAGSPETLVVLAGAAHGFDLQPLAQRPLDQFGHHLEYDAIADAQAFRAAEDFLSQKSPR